MKRSHKHLLGLCTTSSPTHLATIQHVLQYWKCGVPLAIHGLWCLWNHNCMLSLPCCIAFPPTNIHFVWIRIGLMLLPTNNESVVIAPRLNLFNCSIFVTVSLTTEQVQDKIVLHCAKHNRKEANHKHYIFREMMVAKFCFAKYNNALNTINFTVISFYSWKESY